MGKASEESVAILAENGKAVRVVMPVIRGDGVYTQLRRFKRGGKADWTDFTGEERAVSPAVAVTDGPTLQ